jgi:hypothetical protein
MFSKIKAFFVRVEHDVEAIIANFTNTVAKLEAAVEAKNAEAAARDAASRVEAAAAAEARDVAKRAYDVAEKIKALVA